MRVWAALMVLAILLFVFIFVHSEYSKRALTIENQIDSVAMNTSTTTFALASSAFDNNGTIPAKYTCDRVEKNPPGPINPPLSISGVPEGTLSLALVMDDPDVPRQLRPEGVFDHWVLFDIPPGTTEISAGDVPTGKPPAWSVGMNSIGELGYTAPCPPTQYEPSEHRYIFTLYALDRVFAFEQPPTKVQLLDTIKGHILAEAQYVGRYKRASGGVQ